MRSRAVRLNSLSGFSHETGIPFLSLFIAQAGILAGWRRQDVDAEDLDE